MRYVKFGKTIGEHPEGLRPIYTSTHQGSSIGWFHKWYEKEGVLHAIIERESGQVDIVTSEYNSFEFLDISD